MIGKLQPIKIEDIVSNISWTKENSNTANSPEKLLSMLPGKVSNWNMI